MRLTCQPAIRFFSYMRKQPICLFTNFLTDSKVAIIFKRQNYLDRQSPITVNFAHDKERLFSDKIPSDIESRLYNSNSGLKE